MNEADIRGSLTGTGGVRLRHLRIECPTESAAAGKSFDTDGTSSIEGGIATIAAATEKFSQKGVERHG
jgi:hypothetical protein